MNNIKKLKPVEILMLNYAHKFHTGANDFQQFWNFRYNVNPEDILHRLYNGGYIALSPIDVSVSHKSVAELKDILSENNLKVTGKKAVLVSRIIDSLSTEQLKHYFPHQYYCLTPSGKEIVENNPNILFAHRNQIFDLSIDEVPEHDIFGYIYNKLNLLSKEYRYYNNWSSYRYCLLQYTELLNLQQRYEEAIYYYVYICYYDISGLQNGIEPERLYESRQYIINSWPDPKKLLAEGIISGIRINAQKLRLSENDIIKICEDAVHRVNLPFHLFDKETAIKIIVERLFFGRIYSPVQNDIK